MPNATEEWGCMPNATEEFSIGFDPEASPRFYGVPNTSIFSDPVVMPEPEGVVMPMGTIVRISDHLRDFSNTRPGIDRGMLALQGIYSVITGIPTLDGRYMYYRIAIDNGEHSWHRGYFSETLPPLAIGDTIEISEAPENYGACSSMIPYAGARAKIMRIHSGDDFGIDIDSGRHTWNFKHFNARSIVRAGQEMPHALRKRQYQILQGWELETCNIPSVFDKSEMAVKRFIKDIAANGISMHNDGSVSGRSLEFILSHPKTCSESLNTLQWFMEKYPPKIDKTCGLHFHFSVHELMDDGDIMPLKVIEKSRFVNNLFALCSMYEDQLFLLFPESRQHNSYCCRFREKYTVNTAGIREKLGYISDCKSSNTKRYCWLNVVEMYREGGHGTVEFRILGDTSNLAYICNVALMFQYLVKESMLLNIQKSPDKLNIINKTLHDPYMREVKAIKDSADLTAAYIKPYISRVISESEKMQVFTRGKR